MTCVRRFAVYPQYRHPATACSYRSRNNPGPYACIDCRRPPHHQKKYFLDPSIAYRHSGLREAVNGEEAVSKAQKLQGALKGSKPTSKGRRFIMPR